MKKAMIEMEYAQALMQAKKLEEIAEGLYKLSDTNINEANQIVRNNWQGDSANMYMQKSEQLGNKINKVAADVNNAAKSIRRIAKEIHDADMLAADIANRRLY